MNIKWHMSCIGDGAWSIDESLSNCVDTKNWKQKLTCISNAVKRTSAENASDSYLEAWSDY
jgi:hypothetical protein